MPTRPYAVDIPLRWSDMDALRHVNNVQFARILEEARIRGLHEWYAAADPTLERQSILLARCEIDYLRQLHYRDRPVSVRMWVTRVAGASYDFGYEVADSDAPDAEIYATAETTQVAFDLQTQRPVRLSPQFREFLQRYAGEPVAMKRRAR